jgi:hypothetical protein
VMCVVVGVGVKGGGGGKRVVRGVMGGW